MFLSYLLYLHLLCLNNLSALSTPFVVCFVYICYLYLICSIVCYALLSFLIYLYLLWLALFLSAIYTLFTLFVSTMFSFVICSIYIFYSLLYLHLLSIFYPIYLYSQFYHFCYKLYKTIITYNIAYQKVNNWRKTISFLVWLLFIHHLFYLCLLCLNW